MMRWILLPSHHYHLIAIALSVLSASCVSANPTLTQSTVRVFKSTGSVQCADTGANLSTLTQALEAAGLKVLSASCGTDGRMRAAMCGAPDGRIAIFELAAEDVAAAVKLGYAALSTLPDAKLAPCK